MNKDLVDELERWLWEFDFAFQEWAVFSQEEAEKISRFAHEILAIRNDSFFRVD